MAVMWNIHSCTMGLCKSRDDMIKPYMYTCICHSLNKYKYIHNIYLYQLEPHKAVAEVSKIGNL